MAVKPVKADGITPNYPRWATNIEINPDNGESNKYEPPEAKKDKGWERGEVPPRQWLNYNADLIYQWIKYLDEK